MSRSCRKTPITGVTTAESEKAYKQQEHRRERAYVRDALRSGSEEVPGSKEFGNPWSGDKDGKVLFDPREQPELMRK
jgi:hypothetical protein